jgi:hypothetical protein
MEEAVYLAPCFNNAGEYHMRAGTFKFTVVVPIFLFDSLCKDK